MQQTQRIFRLHTRAPLAPLDIWLRDFLLDARAANRTEGTIRFYRLKLQPFLAFLHVNLRT